MSRTTKITFPDGTEQSTAAVTPIPAGTVTNFFQAAAPTGWTQNTSYNNYAMRIVSGTGGGTGGSVGFTTAFASQTPSGTVSNTFSVAATTLSTAQMPSHSHSAPTNNAGGAANYFQAQQNSGALVSTNATGGGGSHTHTLSGGETFTGNAINLAVQYLDNIICTKN